MSADSDKDFAEYVAAALAGLPGVRAVALGGSRVTGAARPDSDWDRAGLPELDGVLAELSAAPDRLRVAVDAAAALLTAAAPG